MAAVEIDGPIIEQTSNLDLPEQVIHKILSFLPGEDAIRASATSKQWRLAWISSPVFSFNEGSVPFKNLDFFDYVDASLALWRDRCDSRVNMERLSLTADFSSDESYSRLNQVIAAATSRNVKVIELRNLNFDELFWIDFDSGLWLILLACNSLDNLSFKCFQFYIANPLSAISSSLKKLKLSCNFIDEGSLKNLLLCFPWLEDLEFGFCYGFDELRVSCPSLRSLKVTLSEDLAQKVVIDAANLQYLSYTRTFRPPGTISFSNCKSLTTLHIDRAVFTTVCTIDKYISQIPLLENLVLDGCEMPGIIHISHSNLRSLKFRRCWRLKKAEIDMPNLRSFRYYGGAIFHISTFKYCSGFLEAKLKLYTGSLDCTEWFWFIRLRNFLESFSNCKVLTLDCHLEGFTEKLRDNYFLPDPLYELKHLEITNLSLPIDDYSSFVDAMVGLFPFVETLSLKTSSAAIFIKFDESGSFSVKSQVSINTSNTEHDQTFQSIKASVDKIVELLSWTGEDSD
ncbi:F-box/LRR-repeat protein At1g06630 [Morus notabilis]|uniref:F-box/LRR-repeat protein At1g06630 n=1 Tax=Morus notabilis TaxID=981085 RepID=UPI000CED0D4B|nr:F-box/LRR-repeat protein At1g06630 [Morus notabilis]XP_024019264.1 F-box/LRR-repeat protein At1g06630 [Morus notabilis]XP_024019266.1 F-box/LRR-repeat protein At1g06630 [Morus notabilis]